MTIPNYKECFNLFEKYKTPIRVKAHCIEVARVSTKLGEALNLCGFKLNIDLISGASLTHDLLRAEENHGEAAATVLEGLGYNEVARIVRNHMKYNGFLKKIIDEEAIVCLSDRIVLENKYVGLEKRMNYILEKKSYNKIVEDKIKRIKREVETYIEYLESILGKSINEVIEG